MSLIDQIMSSPNVNESQDVTDSVEIGASATAPVNVDDVADEASKSNKNVAVQRKPKRKTTKVWNDVTEHDKNGRKYVKCNYCRLELAVSKGVSTTTFNRHVEKCSVRQTQLLGKGAGGSQQTMLSFDSDIGGSGAVTSYKYDKEGVYELTAKMIMVHEYPFSMVEHRVFRMYSKKLNPKYEPIGRLAIKERVMRLFSQEKEKMKETFANVGRISLTSDLWTSKHTKSYMCITGHFVDEEWNLQSRILNFCLLPPPYTGVVIADKISYCLTEWGLEDKVGSITFDNATSNDTASHSLKEQFESRGALYFDGKILQVRCCAHIINLMVKDGLDAIKGFIEKVRESVRYIKLTPSRLHKWNEAVKNLGLPTNKNLIHDVPTRWNSTYHMLERALIFKDVFPRYASRDTQYKLTPYEEEWKIARDVCKFLAAFNKVTEIFSGRDYVTSNLYFPEIWKIRKLLDDFEKDSRPFMKDIVAKMKAKFDKYWEDTNILMVLAMVLDPRNKLEWIQFMFEKIYVADKVEDKVKKVMQEWNALFEEYSRKCRMEEGESFYCAKGGTDSMDESDRLAFQEWLKTKTVVHPSTKEIDKYLDDGLVSGGKSFDVLAHWKQYMSRFPILSEMARYIMAFPVTSVPSESAFSTGRRVLGDDRCSLGDATLEALVCGQNWFKTHQDLLDDGSVLLD